MPVHAVTPHMIAIATYIKGINYTKIDSGHLHPSSWRGNIVIGDPHE